MEHGAHLHHRSCPLPTLSAPPPSHPPPDLPAMVGSSTSGKALAFLLALLGGECTAAKHFTAVLRQHPQVEQCSAGSASFMSRAMPMELA